MAGGVFFLHIDNYAEILNNMFFDPCVRQLLLEWIPICFENNVLSNLNAISHEPVV